MSTRSSIAIQNDNDTVIGIYCHSDGYLDYNGKMLAEHYKDEAKVRGLIALGSISSLAEKIGCPKGHTYHKPVKGYVRAYHRDRGDTWEDTQPSTEKNYTKFLDSMSQEFDYLFKDGQWYVIDHGDFQQLLVTALENE